MLGEIGQVPSLKQIHQGCDESVVRTGIEDDRNKVNEYCDATLVAVDERWDE